jgi:hypothetical protein
MFRKATQFLSSAASTMKTLAKDPRAVSSAAYGVLNTRMWTNCKSLFSETPVDVSSLTDTCNKFTYAKESFAGPIVPFVLFAASSLTFYCVVWPIAKKYIKYITHMAQQYRQYQAVQAFYRTRGTPVIFMPRFSPGEVLTDEELAIRSALAPKAPTAPLAPVPKGMRGSV